MFVFLSGMASAIAFGGTFDRQGTWILTASIAHRIRPLWWVHLCLFVAVFALLIAAGDTPAGRPYTLQLNVGPLLQDPALLLDFRRLGYVPNYFDILPMYVVVLALMRVMLWAERPHHALPFPAEP